MGDDFLSRFMERLQTVGNAPRCASFKLESALSAAVTSSGLTAGWAARPIPRHLV